MLEFYTQRGRCTIVFLPTCINLRVVCRKKAQTMHLQYFLVDGKRVYTLKKLDPEGNATMSAHPARFSPDDKYSKQRVGLKRRFKILIADKKPISM